jgi:predicted dehydrogenase
LAKKYRVAVAGLVHDHIWSVLKSFAEHPQVDLVGAADPNPPLLDQVKRQAGIDEHFHDVTEMLDKVKPDIVLVYTDNASGADVVEAAAERGIHAVVEKPMAATLEQADRMLMAAEKHGTYLMINWPIAWNASYRHAFKLAKEGDVGHIWHVRHHSSHEGPREIGCSQYFWEWLYDKRRNGAGALIDYCSYGAVINSYLLGRPNAVTGVAGRFVKTDIAVDDNAVLILKYPHAVGLTEGSWTQVGYVPYGLLINGIEGALVVGHDKRLLRTDRKNIHGVELDVPPVPDGERNPAEYLIGRIEKGQPVEGILNARVSRDAQEILEAGVISAETGTAVTLPVFSRR